MLLEESRMWLELGISANDLEINHLLNAHKTCTKHVH